MKTIYSTSLLIVTVFLVLFITRTTVVAQNVGISTSGTYNAYDAAILDLDGGTSTATYRGLLPPRMTSAERDDFDDSFVLGGNTLAGAVGMMIYNETTARYETFTFLGGGVFNPANYAWKQVANEDDLGGGNFINNDVIEQVGADFWIDGTGRIGSTLQVDGATTLGSTGTVANSFKVGNGIVVGDIVTATPGAGNILMSIDDSWLGRGATSADPRIAFNTASEFIRISPVGSAIVAVDKANVGHTALEVNNIGAAGGVGIKLAGNRNLATGDVGYIEFENSDASVATVATLARIQVKNSAADNTNGSFQIALRSSGSMPASNLEQLRLDHLGNLVINGKFTSNGIKETSDGRFKKNITRISNALSAVLSLEGVTYNWRTEEFPERFFTERMEYGVIAQQIEEVVPELVDTDDNGYKSVQYSHMVPLLIEAIKEQQKIIASQHQEIGILKASVDAISEHMKTANK